MEKSIRLGTFEDLDPAAQLALAEEALGKFRELRSTPDGKRDSRELYMAAKANQVEVGSLDNPGIKFGRYLAEAESFVQRADVIYVVKSGDKENQEKRFKTLGY